MVPRRPLSADMRGTSGHVVGSLLVTTVRMEIKLLFLLESKLILVQKKPLVEKLFLIPGFAGKFLFESGQIPVLGRQKPFGTFSVVNSGQRWKMSKVFFESCRELVQFAFGQRFVNKVFI